MSNNPHPKPLTDLRLPGMPKSRGQGLAIAMVTATIATLGYMYGAAVKTKREEGPMSIYKTAEEGGGNLNTATSDVAMSSADIRGTMHGGKKQ
ncbi:hypothetical protein OBBRIDRAFT_797489 [Obba rivulosa]|uniref:Uncharacterized protein n=1 Tax=Obba rivulosa TaxID=1052685 RepID=A0A8E2AKF9_9APHY|nr:hypothetical protein OBBRIDRAFT_797489 [Obba rivulosa]